MQNKYMGFLGSIGKRLLRGCVHAGMAGIAIFNFSNVAVAQSDQYYVDLFFSQGYRYCDARKLAKVYNTSPWQAKVTGGRKISWGNLSILTADWRRGVRFFQQYGFSCDQSGLSTEQRKFAYNDASRVVDAWTNGNKSK